MVVDTHGVGSPALCGAPGCKPQPAQRRGAGYLRDAESTEDVNTPPQTNSAQHDNNTFKLMAQRLAIALLVHTYIASCSDPYIYIYINAT